MKFIKTVLKNGLTVVEVPSHDAESVVVDIFVKTGSRSERPEESGISHFLEHFLFKGTEQYPSAMAISELVDSIGGEMNASTGKEYTQYFIKVAHAHLPTIFGVLTDMVRRPLLDPVELEKEKGVIVEEINMYKDTPMYEIENVLERTMWPQDALGRDIAGTKGTVTKFTQAMFRRYMKKHYQTGNTIVGVSGKYDRKQLWSLVKKHWEKAPRQPHGRWAKAKDRQTRPRIALEFKQTEQAHLAFGFKALPYGHPQTAALSVLAAVLGGGMSSRLFSEVREKRGLCYYVRAGAGSYQDTGSFGVNSGVHVDKLQEAVAVIVDELKKVKQHPVPQHELRKAKDYIKGKTTLALEDNQVRLDWFLERAAFFKNMITPVEAFAKIEKVTAADVQAVARHVLTGRNCSFAVIGPYKSKAPLQKLIKID